MSVNASKRKRRPKSVNKNAPSPADLDLIDRLFIFANCPPFTTQEEVYDIFRPHPYVPRVPRADGTVEPYIAPIPKKAGVDPFLNDQAHLRQLLRALASSETRAVNVVQQEVVRKLGEKLRAVLRVDWTKGSLQLRGEAILDGIEVCYYYPLALLFHYDLQRRVKVCEAYLKDEQRDCGNFYLARKERRSGCSDDHNKKVTAQKTQKRVEEYYEKHGRPLAKKRR